MNEGDQQPEIDALEWDAETFSMQSIRPDLQELFKQRRTILCILLKNNGRWTHLRNVYIKRIQHMKGLGLILLMHL
jgi:hypothetical protein